MSGNGTRIEDKLLPPRSQPLPPALDDQFVLKEMGKLLLEFAYSPQPETAEAQTQLAEAFSLRLLGLKHEGMKLLWTRRDMMEVFRRSTEILGKAAAKPV